MKRLLNPKVLVALVLIVGAMVISKMYFPVPLPGIQLPAEGVPILGFRVPNTFIHTILADITLILFAVLATRNMKDIPDGLQNFAEWVIEGFYSITEDIAGDRARRWFPIIMTIFLLVIVANWWELVPGVDSVGVIEAPHGGKGYIVEKIGPFYTVTNEEVVVEHYGEEGAKEAEKGEGGAEAEAKEEHGLPKTEDGREYGVLIPFLRASATDLNFTLALAVISMVLVQYYGIQALGMSYFSKFINFKGGIMGFIVGLIETVSEVAKIISFAFRLFGNIFAGQVLLFIMAFLVPWLLPVPFFGLELFVGFIQAFVFAMLTLVFFASAVEAHDEHH